MKKLFIFYNKKVGDIKKVVKKLKKAFNAAIKIA